ncbi:MAG: phosphoglycerate kinase [Acidobacteria bacterium]|nr:phosphoglycerate kinase [Acidobacteriota bacterium]
MPTIDSLEVADKTVLVRADLNVPMSRGVVSDDFRIAASVPTIEMLRSRGAQVVVCSHLGRPDGVDELLRMAPVAHRLGEIGDFPILSLSETVGDAVKESIDRAERETVVVLENTRFDEGEVRNDPEFADQMAGLADLFVNDAFGTAHRSHASNVGVASRIPSAAGVLLRSEIDAFDVLLDSPDRPYVVVLGGAKVSDKLAVMKRLLPKVDMMLVGGGMCFTLLAAAGYEIGRSLVEDSMIDEVKVLLKGEHGAKILLPADVVVAESFAPDAAHHVTAGTAIPSTGMGLDIGPRATQEFADVIAAAARVFWNGPMGVFEWEAFRSGTAGIANAVAYASSNGFTVVGGGDSVAALRMFEIDRDISHVSSGGGAGLKFLEGEVLPGVAVLERWSTHA